MTKKIIELTPSAAIQIEAIKMADGNKYLSLRKMFKRKKDTEWQVGHQGMTLPWDESEEILKKALKLIFDPETKFRKLEAKEKKEE
jgi:hypothetical protein